ALIDASGDLADGGPGSPRTVCPPAARRRGGVATRRVPASAPGGGGIFLTICRESCERREGGRCEVRDEATSAGYAGSAPCLAMQRLEITQTDMAAVADPDEVVLRDELDDGLADDSLPVPPRALRVDEVGAAGGRAHAHAR